MSSLQQPQQYYYPTRPKVQVTPKPVAGLVFRLIVAVLVVSVVIASPMGVSILHQAVTTASAGAYAIVNEKGFFTWYGTFAYTVALGATMAVVTFKNRGLLA